MLAGEDEAVSRQLADFGWDEAWHSELEAVHSELPGRALQPARVVRAEALQVDVWTDEGVRTVHLPSRRRRGEQRPAVGDWVVVTASADQSARVEAILPRRTCFSRKAAGRRTERQIIATNIDRVFVVSSLDGDFSLRRIERYLTAVLDSGAEPVVLLTKAGLHDAPQTAVAQARGVAGEVPVHAIDVVDGVDPHVADPYLQPRTTVALVGSSGVGKSTLVNYWLGEARQQTAPVREHDSRGQHTTVSRELFHLASGAMVIDTPGMRELALWVDPSALDRAFADIDALASGCRFADCRHESEPGCAVNAALASGELDPSRLQSYRELRAEILQTTANMPEHERRRRERSGSLMIREVKRLKRHRR